MALYLVHACVLLGFALDAQKGLTFMHVDLHGQSVLSHNRLERHVFYVECLGLSPNDLCCVVCSCTAERAQNCRQ